MSNIVKEDEAVRIGNISKEMMLDRLLIDNAIDQKTYDFYTTNYHIVLIRRNWLVEWCRKIFFGDNDTKVALLYLGRRFATDEEAYNEALGNDNSKS